MEKLLPQNIEAERGVLGSIIIDPDALYDVAAFLHAADFYRDAHKTIYEAMLLLHNNQEQADFITICDTLERQNALSQVGGASYITSLINNVPSSGNAEFYGRIVERTAILRRLIHAAGEIAAMAYDEVDARLAVEKAEQLICAISLSSENGTTSGPMTQADALMDFMQQLDRINRPDTPVGIETGFTDLDFKMGGLQPQELYLLGGPPAEGKTSLLLNIMYQLWEKKTRVAMFSLEMSRNELMRRLVSIHTGIDSQILRSRQLDSDQWEKVVEATGVLSCDYVHLDETPALTVGQICSRARRIQMQHGLDFVMVDYLQLVQGDTINGRRDEKRYEEIEAVANRLKALAKELNVPVLVCVAINGTGEAEPQLSDLRESKGVGYIADLVMFIRRAREQPGHSIISIKKHRNGPIGNVTLKFEPSLTRFLNVAGETRDKALAAQSVWPRETESESRS